MGKKLRQWIPISLILLLSAALYLYQLDQKSLWFDELISIGDAKELGQGRTFRKGRLLYYTLLRIWMIFGESDAWLRLLAVLFGVGSVFLIYQLGRRLFEEPTGLLAALLLAVSPVFINHAQEVRYYTMSICIGLAGSLALAHALENPAASRGRWSWAILRFLAIITTPLNAVLLVPDIALIGLKFRKQRKVLWDFGKGLLLIVFLCLPGAFSVASSSSEHKLTLPIPDFVDVLRELRFFTAYPFPPPPPYFTLFIQGFIFLLLGLLSIALFNKPRPEHLRWVAAWAFLPLAAIFLFSHLFYSIWVTRYLLLSSPYILLLLAVGFLKIWRQWRTVAIGVAIVYTFTVGIGLVHYYTVPQRYIGRTVDYRSIIHTINTNEKPGDVIVWSIHHTRPRLSLEHYYRGAATIYLKESILDKAADPKFAQSWLSSLPAIQSRLWLVCSLENPQAFSSVLAEKFDVKFHQEAGLVNSFLVTPKSAPPQVKSSVR
ncbi:MAG: glycosyltransferase family 39 protein [Coleofasciculus sp. S288]|nr:glycosyltransferase family 39 protein [Coleofasciculus sp. S288]